MGKNIVVPIAAFNGYQEGEIRRMEREQAGVDDGDPGGTYCCSIALVPVGVEMVRLLLNNPSAFARGEGPVLERLVRAYQEIIGPELLLEGRNAHCRFRPSCSNYALQAIDRYGSIRGGALAIGRIARCTPFSLGGEDPVR